MPIKNDLPSVNKMFETDGWMVVRTESCLILLVCSLGARALCSACLWECPSQQGGAAALTSGTENHVVGPKKRFTLDFLGP